MPTTRAPHDDRSTSAVTRIISGVPHAVLCTLREDDRPFDRAFDVTIRNGVTGARFTGSCNRLHANDACDDDSDARWRSTMDALTSAKSKDVSDVFDFALERSEEDGDGKRWELVWRFSEEARAERFDAPEDEEEEETAVKVGRKSSKSGGKMRIGVLELREDETWDAMRCGMDALACAESAERSEARANAAEACAKRLVLGAETSRRRADEAIEAMKETKEDMARRVMALLNAKKTEMRRMRETLDAAEAEVEDLNARLERARASGMASGTAPVEDGDDGGLTLFEEDDDSGEYTTDDEAHPTQRGERVSMRKRFGKQTQTQTQTQSQSQSRKRTKTTTKKQSTTTRQKKSFLANTLALLDTE